jgi:hypothetical protein
MITALPSLQPLASRIATYFLPAVSNQVDINIPLMEFPGEETRVIYDLENGSSIVGFHVKSPNPIPLGYAFTGAELRPAREAIILNYKSSFGGILRISQRRTDVEYQSVSINAIIETVKIGSSQGEYVVGGWKSDPRVAVTLTPNQSITFQAEWHPDADIQFLRWEDNDILYEILFVGTGTDAAQNLGKQDLIDIAKNLR